MRRKAGYGKKDKRRVCLFLPFYRPSNMMPALKILLSAYCHSNRKRNRWSLSVRRRTLSPSTWAFTSVVTHPGPSWRVTRDPSAHSRLSGVLESWSAFVFIFIAVFFFFFFWRRAPFAVECFALSGCSASEVGTGPLFANDAIITYIQALVCRIHVEVIDVLENDSFFDIAPPFVSIQWKLRAVFFPPLLCVYFDSDISLSI